MANVYPSARRPHRVLRWMAFLLVWAVGLFMAMLGWTTYKQGLGEVTFGPLGALIVGLPYHVAITAGPIAVSYAVWQRAMPRSRLTAGCLLFGATYALVTAAGLILLSLGLSLQEPGRELEMFAHWLGEGIWYAVMPAPLLALVPSIFRRRDQSA